MATGVWNTEKLKLGIDRFILEQGRAPSARDFDETPYLPSARQIQRAFGGLVQLRRDLNYPDLDFTKGELRKVIAAAGNKRGTAAEEVLEELLIKKFGEAYVHTQKRYYKGSKNRYDFLVYAKGATFGIDVFTTDRANYIDKNIRHKILRYKNAPATLPIYFVLIGQDFGTADIEKAKYSVRELASHTNMIPIHETDFMELLKRYSSLEEPYGYTSLGSL